MDIHGFQCADAVFQIKGVQVSSFDFKHVKIARNFCWGSVKADLRFGCIMSSRGYSGL